MKDFVNTLNDEQKAALLAALSSTQAESTHLVKEEKVNTVDDFRMHKTSNLPTNSRREPVKAHKNMWIDNSIDARGSETQTKDYTPTPRTRKIPKKKSIICNSCGKRYDINSNLVYGEYYRCEKCVGKNGR